MKYFYYCDGLEHKTGYLWSPSWFAIIKTLTFWERKLIVKILKHALVNENCIFAFMWNSITTTLTKSTFHWTMQYQGCLPEYLSEVIQACDHFWDIYMIPSYAFTYKEMWYKNAVIFCMAAKWNMECIWSASDLIRNWMSI